MKKKLSILTIIILIALAVYYYKTNTKPSSTSTPKETNEIVVGVLGPFTGEGSTYGEAMKKGIDLALDIINNKGEKKYTASYQDSKLSANDAISAFKYLTQKENVPIIFGPAGSSIALTLSPFANKNKTVLFSSISSSDDLKNAGEYFFRNIPPNSNQAIKAVDFCIDKNKQNNVAIIYENNDYGLNMKTVFTNDITKKGGKVVYENSYESGASDFKNVIIPLKKVQPDIIFIPGTYQEIAVILRQLKEMKINSIIISGDGAYSPDLIKIAGKASEGMYCTLMSIPDENTQEYKDFEKLYTQKYNEKPNVYAVYSYDAVMMFYESSKDLKDLNGEKVKNALKNYTYHGVTGETKFDEFNEVNKSYSLYKIINGKFEKVNE